ncbi:MAG: GTPase Era [Chloroflexi bacterium]|nr:GTPase Era [Chloroflexota bacterium]MCC6896469.1 GTPase Era [Anaerolineae bacterium]
MNDLDTVFDDVLPPDHRSGVVSVVGRPNVGKSTLINRILGQKIAIVSPKPQTTRRQQMGIYTDSKSQILFMDTPGLHTPHHKLGEYMVGVAEEALKDADIILWVLDISVEPTKEDRQIAELVERSRGDTPVILALNKVDLVDPKTREAHLDAYGELVDNEAAIMVSAVQGDGVPDLVDYLREGMPEGPRYYPVDQVSEVNMRFIAAEVIREKIILNTEKEVPYSVAVEVEEYKERSETMTYISATIYVERDSQKGILIGKNGDMIKRIGSEARAELADMLGTQAYIELRVKVLKNWRMDEDLMRRLGYRLPKKGD